MTEKNDIKDLSKIYVIIYVHLTFNAILYFQLEKTCFFIIL